MNAEETLAYCLQDIESGRKTLAECVATFPDVPELEAQLLAVQALKKWPLPVIRPVASQRIETNLRRQVRAQTRARKNLLVRASQKFTPAMRWAIMAAVLFALFFAGAGTVAASASSMPGELLYPLKRAGEAVELALTRPADRSAYHTKLARNRLDELSTLVARGNADPALINTLSREIAAETEAAISTVNQASADAQAHLWQQILAETERQQSTLQTIKNNAPPQAQATLESTLDESAQHNSVARDAIENPTDEPMLATATPTSTPVLPTLAPTQSPSNITSPPLPTAGETVITSGPTSTPQPTTTLTEQPAGSPASTPTQPASAGPNHTSPAPTPTVPAPTANNGGGGSGNPPNCHANNPHSPNYCTPTPQPSTAPPESPSTSAPSNNPTPTACPTNPGGQPKCK